MMAAECEHGLGRIDCPVHRLIDAQTARDTREAAIKAVALREAADWAEGNAVGSLSIEWLRGRADRLDEGGSS
jgi:hypothetical protein